MTDRRKVGTGARSRPKWLCVPLLVVCLVLTAACSDEEEGAMGATTPEDHSTAVCRDFAILAAKGLSAELTNREMLQEMRSIAGEAKRATSEVRAGAEALLEAYEKKDGYPGDRVLKRLVDACRPFRPPEKAFEENG